MLELINLNPHLYFANLYNGFDKNQFSQLTSVIKSSWQFDNSGNLQRLKLSAIEEIDRYLGEPGKSNLMAASEIMPFKERSEILLYGSAQPSQKSTSQVSIKIEWPDGKTWQKTLTIFGERYWQNSLFGFKPSQPVLLQKPLLLNYENVFSDNDSNSIDNVKRPLSQIEIEPFIKKITDRRIPAGLSPMPFHWQQNTNIQTNRAPQDQQFNQPFRGGEKIYLQGLIAGISVEQSVKILLPTLKPNLKFFLQGQSQILTPTCDTITINADKMILEMLWRTGILWDAENDRDGILLLS